MPLRSGTPHHRGQLHSGTPAPMGVSSEGEEGRKCGGNWEREGGEENEERRMERGRTGRGRKRGEWGR